MDMKPIRLFFAVVELRTKVVSVSTLILATLYTVRRGAFPPLLPFVLMWAATLAVDMGTTAFNNYYDYWRGTDRFRDVNEKDKVVARAEVEPGFAFTSAFWCYAAALALGLALALGGNLWVLPAGALCMAVGFFYTGGPFPLSRTPLGELFAGGCLGLALFAIACGVWSVPFDKGVFRAGLPSLFWIASILAVNNTCDIEGDKAAGRKTFSILAGAKGGEAFVLFLTAAGQISGIAAALQGYLPRFAAVTLAAGSVPAAYILYSMHRGGYSHATKGKNMQGILSAFLLFTLTLALGYFPAGIP